MLRLGLVLAALLAAPLAHAQLRTDLELSGGLALNQLSNQNDLTVFGQTIPGLAADYPLAAGFDGDLRVRLGTDNVAVRLGAGTLTTGTVFDVSTRLLGRDDLRASFATVSAEVEAGGRLGPARLYLVGGPELRYLLSRNDDEGPLDLGDVNRFHTALAVGTGARFDAGPVTVGPEVSASLGLARFADDEFSLLGQRVVLEEGFVLDNLAIGLTIGRRL
ncbi:MAG: hypothetical protein AAGI52_16245 [Bacteroidota bacterium]